MKCALFFCFAFFNLTYLAEAHTFIPPTLDKVAGSDSIYVVKAISQVTGSGSAYPAKITFSVAEVLRGPTRSEFTLIAYERGDYYKKDSTWIIFHNPSGFKDCVGWAWEGDCEWLPIQITGESDQETADWLGPLDKIKEYLSQHPYKP